MDYDKARANMVESQIRPNDVTDLRILKAFYEVPREEFLPASMRPLAYMDEAVQVLPGNGGAGPRYLLRPMVLARLISFLAPQETDLVLDIGCATGYSTAIFAHLAESVVGLESEPELVRLAEAALSKLSIDNAAVIAGSLEDGLASEGPYDAILFNGAIENVPVDIFAQLDDGGRLAAIISKDGYDRAFLYERSGDSITGRPVFEAGAPPLPGFTQTAGFVF